MLIALCIFLLIIVILALSPVQPTNRRWTVDIFRLRFGLQHDMLYHRDGRKYMERWIIYPGLGTLRLHKFWSPDDSRAYHSHPWPFITFPLKGYGESVCTGTTYMACNFRYVKPFRFHYRSADFKHIVVGGSKPFYTFVVTGFRINDWGFYPYNPETGRREFVHWKNWDWKDWV